MKAGDGTLDVLWALRDMPKDGIPTPHVLVLFAIITHRNREGQIVVSVNQLVQATGLARSSVQAALAGLRRAGLLKRVERRAGDRQLASAFELQLHAVDRGARPAGPSVVRAGPPDGQEQPGAQAPGARDTGPGGPGAGHTEDLAEDRSEDLSPDRARDARGDGPRLVVAPRPIAARPPRSASDDGEMGTAFDAWQRGIRDVTGAPSVRMSINDRRTLAEIFDSDHARGLTGEPLLAWARETARAFASTVDRAYGLSPHRAKRWLEDNRPSRSAPRGSAGHKQGLDDAGNLDPNSWTAKNLGALG